MKEFTIIFNDFNCYKYLRNGVSGFIKDIVPSDSLFIEIALNEAVNNAIKHGNNNKVLVRLKVLKNGKLIIRVKDKGTGFDVYETVRKSNEENLLNDINYSILKESGRGLFIIQQVMDKIIFNNKGNDVILVKKMKNTCK